MLSRAVLATLTRLDEDEGVFFLRELEHIQSQLYEIEYPAIKHRALIPVSSEADPADTTITYQQLDKVGIAKVISNYANDLPRVDVLGEEFTARIKSLGASYGYNIQEIRAAKKVGRPLDMLRAETAREAMLRQESVIAWNGDPANKLLGVLDNKNTQLVVFTPDKAIDVVRGADHPAPTANTIHLFGGGTSAIDPVVLLRQLNALVNSVSEISKGVEQPNTLLTSLAVYNLIATTKLSDASSYTVLKYFMETSPYIKTIDWVSEFSNAGDVDPQNPNRRGDIMMAYDRNPRKIQMHIPMDFTQYAPQPNGLDYEVPCESRFGGVTIYRPLSVAIARNA